MDKAKMTFRFEQSRRTASQKPRETEVIPLRQEEYEAAWTNEESPYRTAETTETKASVAGSVFRIPPRQPAQEEGPSETNSLNHYTTDFGNWQSPFDAETQRVEQLIRRAGKPVHDPVTGYYEPDGRESDEIRGGARWHEPEPFAFYGKPPQTSWLKVTASVAGAVVTGVAFGFLVLSMFSGSDAGQPQATTGAAAQQTGAKSAVQPGGAAGAPAAAAGGGTASAAPPAGQASPAAPVSAGQSVSAAVAGMGTVPVNLAPKTYTLLQGGVFSSASGAETAVADFRKKGFAAVTVPADKAPVYVGLALNRDEAAILKQQYEQKNIDVILKTFDVPGAAKIRWNGKSADLLQTYMLQGDKLVQQIAAQSVLHLNEGTPTALDDKALQAIKSAHQAWSASVSAVGDGLGEAGKISLPAMNSALNTAVVSLEEYKKNPSAALMWQAQTAVMQYVAAEKELLSVAAAP